MDKGREIRASKTKETAKLLRNDFLGTANWRREKAVEYPADPVKRPKYSDRLAGTVDQVEPGLLEVYAELFEDCEGDEVERHGELLDEVGFHWDPKTATEFVQRFIAEMTGGRINSSDGNT
jgi:hypothetical protein